MSTLIYTFILPCEKATLLMEKQLEHKSLGKNLGIYERMRLFMHLKNCEVCGYYFEQSKKLEMWLKSEKFRQDLEQRNFQENFEKKILESLKILSLDNETNNN